MANESDMTGTIVSSTRAGEPTAPPVEHAAGAKRPNPPVESVQSVSATEDDEKRLTSDRRWPAWLVSTILHLFALLVLTFWTHRGSGDQAGINITAQRGERSDAVSFQMVRPSSPVVNQHNALSERPVQVKIQLSQSTLVPNSLVTQSDTATLDPTTIAMVLSGGRQSEAAVMRLPGGGLEGRTPEGRTKFGERFGATGASEEAVELALQWLALHQRPNGSWSFNLELDPCGGQCKNSKVADGTPTPTTAATGLALLAFLGAGHTHQSGPYAETIRRGIYYLRQAAGESQFGFDWQQGSMYGHGIALMALAEATTMTQHEDGSYESDLLNLVDRGSYFTVVAQHGNGSWGYVPGSPGDTTLTGWQVLSLVAAKRNGIQLRTNTLSDARSFLRTVVATKDFEFGYKGPPAEPTTTAIGLTLMMYLGYGPGYTPLDEALDRLAQRGPTLTNVYHDYYATLALHHARHRDWDKWNHKLREHLVRSQAKQGHQRGSWHFKDKWGDIGGRLYTTAMCTMMLEVYYRYLPLYDDTGEFPL